ncbi:energy-coupling factor ABC transporter ATP-binding protein [Mycolicibacterium nivoides]|uniref:ABC transporter ATP-binding protein n=1 Tax=Mycolicibacterium nivoides TaxID=2487344 RepID=A0ABW9LK08_9MYCO
MSYRELTASELRYAYPDGREVLRDANLLVPGRSRVALLGANGSGKTTLLRCLSGAITPHSGTVAIDGRALRHTRRGLREHRIEVQLVFQDPDDQLFSVDVAHDIAYGPTNLGLGSVEVRDRVDEAMELLGITALRDRPTHQLSFGERKRAAIAGAVAMRPCILLLDEPTAGVDPAGVDEIFAALERLEGNATTVVLSTHDTALALDWATSVAVMEGGRTRQGRPVELLGDADLVARARLRMPWLLSLARDMADDGTITRGSSPASAAELRKEVVRLFGRSGLGVRLTGV